MRTAFLSILAAIVVVGVASDCAVSDSSKTDCGFLGVTQSQCESKGCCWAESSTSGIPWCFYQSGYNSNCFGYQVDFYLIFIYRYYTFSDFRVLYA